MISKCFAWRIVLIFLFSIQVCIARAQPALPDIAGSAEKGIVLLTWNCQYDGVNAITVMRSTDSFFNYSSVGNVKKLNKGIQVFVDGHPATGKNFYKLMVVFKSGLKWSSNYCRVYLDKPAQGPKTPRLPCNDSLQSYVALNNENVTAAKRDNSSKRNGGPARANDENSDMENNADLSMPKISISMPSDTIRINAQPWREAAPPEYRKPKMAISFDDPASGPPTFIKSQFLYTDQTSGHVIINLPDNVSVYHYSLKILDLQNHVIWEVPKINAPKMIMDRRNFQQRGLYKFILRRDAVEFESGCITIN